MGLLQVVALCKRPNVMLTYQLIAYVDWSNTITRCWGWGRCGVTVQRQTRPQMPGGGRGVCGEGEGASEGVRIAALGYRPSESPRPRGDWGNPSTCQRWGDDKGRNKQRGDGGGSSTLTQIESHACHFMQLIDYLTANLFNTSVPGLISYRLW